MSDNRTGDAKSYERLGNRLTLPQTADTYKRQKEDALHNIKSELKTEGHTGKLTEADGLDRRVKPFKYKGFLVELFGRVEYQSKLDPFGHLAWIGTAEGEVTIRGTAQKMIFDIEAMVPHGFEDIRAAAQYLIRLVDLFRNPTIKQQKQ